VNLKNARCNNKDTKFKDKSFLSVEQNHYSLFLVQLHVSAINIISQSKVKNAWESSCVRRNESDLFLNDPQTQLDVRHEKIKYTRTKRSVAGSRFEARTVTHNTVLYFLPTLQIIEIIFTKKWKVVKFEGCDTVSSGQWSTTLHRTKCRHRQIKKQGFSWDCRTL
jgi:hypothetical protein